MIRKINTLHVTPELYQYKIGGIGTVVTELHKNRKEDEHFLLIVTELLEDMKLNYDGLSYNTVNNLLKEIKKINAEKIIFHNYNFAKIYSNHVKNIDNCYYVIHSNIIMERFYQSSSFNDNDVNDFIDILQKFRLIAISEYEKSLLLDFAERFDIKFKYDIEVIHNGYNFNKKEVFVKRNENVFGYIGRLDERKGIINLINQFKGIDSTLLIATGGIFNPIMKPLFVNSLALNTIPIGFCIGKRKDSFFKSIDALIIPSLYEPFGMVVLESIERGIIPICNKTGGIVEILGEDYPLYFDITINGDLQRAINKFKQMDENSIYNLLYKIYYNSIDKFSNEKMINRYRNL